MPDYIGIKEACAILQQRGAKVSPQLINHYCVTGRAPIGTIKTGNHWIFTRQGVANWYPKIKKAGRPRKEIT